MRMDGQEESENVEDVRGHRGSGFGLRGGSVGIGTVLVALIVGWLFGINPLALLGMMESGGPVVQQDAAQGTAPPVDDAQARFVSQVLRSTEDVWTEAFREAGASYEKPRLRLFSSSYPTACGMGQSAMGPFYCPGDRIVYLDMRFFDVMRTRLGAPGEFAQAYVIGHEVGHHVQNLLGVLGKVDAARQRGSEAQANALSVRLELQADCFAGVWARRSQQQQGWRLEPGDIEAALNAASQIGDDTLQRRSGGQVVPESFTHGSSAQRVEWFKRGVKSGNAGDCNTFDVALGSN